MSNKFLCVIQKILTFFWSFPRSTVVDVILHPLEMGSYLFYMHYVLPQNRYIWGLNLDSTNNAYFNTMIWVLLPFLTPPVADFASFPNIFALEYVKHIYSVDGLPGCYRGVVPKILEHVLLFAISKPLWLLFTDENTLLECGFLTEISFQIIRIILSHPIRVIMISSFAEFLYNENNSTLTVASTIFKYHGYKGFLTGLGYRLGAEVTFFTGIYLMDKVFQLQRRSAYSMAEAMLIYLRDGLMKCMSTPLYSMALWEISTSTLSPTKMQWKL